jgi:ubiquinone/menaquinone biosynthesis C-methylase UbiE
MFTPERLDTPELLDEHDAPRDDMERSLRDLRLINEYFGGVRTYNRLLRRFGGPVRSIIDLGSGTADLLDSVEGDVKRIAVDFKIDHLLYERRRSKALRVVADAHHLPFCNDAADVVTSAHFFHHFGPDENVGILKESLRIGRRGVVVNDTRRHYAPLLFVTLIGALRLVGRITRADAPASVRRGYTIEEARAVGERTGAARVRVVRSFPYRNGLLLWKQPT